MSPANAARASEVSSSREPTSVAPRYRVFLSYSHADTKWARWLMRRLETYRVSRRFHGRQAPIGEVGLRIAPVFRDRDELPTTSDLGETIRGALREAATLVVICSPRSARSRWVTEEIRSFKRMHGERNVFAFIVAGEPKVEGAADDCFPLALRREVGPDGTFSGAPAEVVAADARPEGDGPRLAFIRLVAGLLGVGFDELRQRELHRRNRRLTFIAIGSAAGMALTLGLAVLAWRARNEAVLARNDAQRRQDQAEDVLAFMLNDFREELKKVGRTDLLTKVGDKAMTYFDALDPRDLTDTALARHAKALTQIGEVQMEQKDVRYAEAARSFVTAYQRAAALAARHPKNGDMLFERAQAEFWIGLVYFRRGNLAAAAPWFTRYRDSGAALVALNPANHVWQRELISGHHNLAVLELERGNLEAARAGFLAEFEPTRRLLAAQPADMQLRFKLTDLESYLGSIAMRTGDYAEARARFAAQHAGLEALVQMEPQTAHWTFKLADCLAWEAEAAMTVGALAEARTCVAQAVALCESLHRRDPANRRWEGMLGLLQVREAALADSVDPAKARAGLQAAQARLEKLAAAEAKDRTNALRLMTALRLEAHLRLAGDGSGAAEAAARALAIGEPLLSESRGNDRFLGMFAHCNITAGRIAAASGKTDEAASFFRRAAEVLASRAASSSDCLLLDPAARALAGLGRVAESQALIGRLHGMGYVPLEPWPPSISPAIKSHHQK